MTRETQVHRSKSGNRIFPKSLGAHRVHWFRLMALASRAGLAFFLTSVPASAQILQRSLPDVRPGDQRQTVPAFEEPADSETGSILPAYPLPEPGGVDDLEMGQEVLVEKIIIEGNTVLPDSVLNNIARDYAGRQLSAAGLRSLRDRLTLAYIQRGYATSGASLSEKALRGGVLRVQIIEGKLGEVDVAVKGRFKPSYFKSRLLHSQKKILNVHTLQRQLQVFQKNPQIERISARLEPTSTRGVSRLKVTVLEAPLYNAGVDFDNYRSPSIGSLGGSTHGRINNLTGYGDTFYARYTGSSGLNQFEAYFDVPITVWDTRVGAHYQFSMGDIIDSNFAALGIESEAQSIALNLRQPLYRSVRSYIGADIQAEWSRAQSFLGNGAVTLPTDYSTDGRSQISALRFGVDATYRTPKHSLAFRSLISWGIDAFGATINPAEIPDGRFVSWLGQFQSASRLPWFGAVLISRADAQLSPDPLLPLEQFAVGGRYSVRGYRENTLVRDNGVTASLEVRVPVYRLDKHGLRIELAPFADMGSSWNNARSTPTSSTATTTIGSIGIGTRAVVDQWGFAEFYWGHRLKEVAVLGESDLQDDGIQFRVSLSWPQ